MTTYSNLSTGELQEELLKFNLTLNQKKEQANKLLNEIENICREMLSIQDLLNSRQNG